MKSTKHKRPPDDSDSDFEDVAPQLASLRLRARKLPLAAPMGEVVPVTNSEPDREDPPAVVHPVKASSRAQVVPDFPLWWEKSVPVRASEIWLPSGHDTSLPASSTRLKDKSWFTLNNIIELQAAEDTSQPTRPSPTPSESTDEKKAVNSILKVRLYPTKSQVKLLNKMFGTYRTIYNKLVEVSREDCYKTTMTERAAKYRPIS